MNIGIITRNPNGWPSTRLREAIEFLGHRAFLFSFRDIISIVEENSLRFIVNDIDIVRDLSAIIVRPFGRVSLDQAIYRIDLLYAIHSLGIPIFNKPSAIEKCVDKFRALYTLHMHGIPVPKTIVSESSSKIYRFLESIEMTDIVIKPIFGSRGHGSTKLRLRDRDVLWEVLRALMFTRHVLYVQKYIPHGGRDIRAFVIGDSVVASMYRVRPGMWKTNISQGATPIPIKKLPQEIEELAIKSAKILECDIAGVDIIEFKDKYYVIEVNSQPGWRGLQSVSEKNIALEIAKYVVEKSKR